MAESPLYDLLLLLSSDATEDQRTRVLSYVESSISQAGGQIERNDNWGRRPMAFQIRHQSEAEYHLLQFHAPGSIIEDLEHTLRITDGVLRVRIIKVRRGTPAAKGTPPPVVAAVAAGSSSAGGSDGAPLREPTPSAAEAEPTDGETAHAEADAASADSGAAAAATETAAPDEPRAEETAVPAADQGAE